MPALIDGSRTSARVGRRVGRHEGRHGGRHASGVTVRSPSGYVGRHRVVVPTAPLAGRLFAPRRLVPAH